MGYNIPDDPNVHTDYTVGTALAVAGEGCKEINLILTDIQHDNILGNDGAVDTENPASGRDVLDKYGILGNANITEASGAMVIDDLMQKISTEVQVAAQLLSTVNTINKTASRIMSQG